MRKKLKLFIASLVFGGFATIGITACGVMPTPVSIDEPDETQQDEMINTLFDTKYLDATLDVNVKYQKKDQETPDHYHLYGDMLVDIASLDNIMADASLHLDMNDPAKTDEKHRLPIINLDLTYLDSMAYVSVNERNLKMKTDDFGEVLEIIMGEDNGEEEQEVESSINNLSNSGVAELINNLAHMSYEDKGTYYEFVSKTTENQPDLVVTTDTNFKIESLSITGIKYNDFTIDVNMATKVLESLETPIVSPETATKKFIDVSTYFGAFKKLRKILDDERFSMNYLLELRHYEPATPEDKVYLGYTRGDLSMDLKKTIVDLRGSTIAINDPTTEGHDDYKTTYQAQYFDENIYLQYNLNQKDASGNPMDYKLSYSNAGLADMWDLLGDESVLGINIFDLIFGASDKEYPIIDIITDGLYRNITEYTQINFTEEYIELDIDNYLLGGKNHGSIKIYIDEYDEDAGRPGIKSITIKDLDINSYIVDGELDFKDYVTIQKVNAVEFHPLDNLDKLIRSGASYYRSNKYALGLDVNVTNPDGETLSINGKAKLRLKDADGNAVLEGGTDIKVVDFANHLHTLKAESKKESTVNNVYVNYIYQGDLDDPTSASAPLKAKASYDSIYNVYKDIMAAISGDSEDEGDSNPLGMIAPYIEGATKDTLDKVMAGDYFAILRDETIKSIEVINGNYKIVIDGPALLGLDDDLVIKINMNKEVLQSIELHVSYNHYVVDGKINLNDYDSEGAYIPDSELPSYLSVDSLSEITHYIAGTSNNGKFKVIDQLMSIYEKKEIGLNLSGTLYKNDNEVFSIANGRLDAKLSDPIGEEDMLNRLSLALTGEFNSIETDEFGNEIPHSIDMQVGYKPNGLGTDSELSLKLGNAMKFKCNRTDLEEILRVINEEILKDNSDLSGLTASTNSISLPILEMLNQKDYQGLLNSFKGASIQGTTMDELKITLSNGLFNKGDESTFDVLLSIDDEYGLRSLGVDGIKYGEYSLTFNIELDPAGYKQANVDAIDSTGFVDLANITGVVYQVKDIINDRSIGLDLLGTYNNISINGSIDVNIKDGSEYVIFLYVTDSRDSENVKYHDIRIDNDGETCYILYATDRKKPEDADTIRITLDENSIQEITSTIQEMIGDEDSYLSEYLSKYIGDLTGMIGGQGSSEEGSGGFDIVSLLYKDYFVDDGIVYTEADPEHSTPATLEVTLKGSELGLEDDPVLLITFNEDGGITNITGDTTIDALPAGIDVTIRDYDADKHNTVIPAAIKNLGEGKWVGANDIKDVVNFVADLDGAKQKAVVDQLDDLMTNKHAALDFQVDIFREINTASISTISGNLYVDFSDLSKFENAVFKASGRVTKENVIDSSFDIRLVDKIAYFLYAHDHEHEDFRVKYDLRNIDELLGVINKYSASNPTFKQLIDGILPTASSSSSTTSSNPISSILSSGNYLQLFKYYVGTSYDSANHELTLIFKGDLIGAPKGNVSISLDVADYGIHRLSLTNFYAFGYYLSGSVTLKPTTQYVTPTAPVDKDTYVPLDYANDILEDVLSLFGDEYRYAKYNLSGKYDDLLIDADIDFDINKDNGAGNPLTNEGSVKVALTMGKKTHYVQADVNAQLISMADYQSDDPEAQKRVDDAAKASTILFSYGDVPSTTDGDGNVQHGAEPAANKKMYGQLNLGSVFDIVELVTSVTGEKSGRIANIMEIFSGDGSKTLFMKILNGDVEALLYNKLIDSFTYNSTTQTYRIVLNEKLFKANDDDQTAPITLTLSTGDHVIEKTINGVKTPVEMKYIRELAVEGIYSGKPIEMRLTATNTSISKITVDPSFNEGHGAYNFNSVQTLANHLLNTVLYDDYTFNGTINLNGYLTIIGVNFEFANATIDVNSFLHIVQNENDKLEDYYAKFDFSNIPLIRVGALGLYYNITDDRGTGAWDNGKRSFTIYLENIVRREGGVAQYEQVPVLDINGDQVFDNDGNPLFKNGSVLRDTYVIIEENHTKGSNTYTRRIKLSLDEFMDNLTHWLINYGMGIKARNNGSVTADKYATLDGDGNLVMATKASDVGAQDFINLFNYHAASDHQATYSTLLQSYNYYDVGDYITSDDKVLDPKIAENKTWTTTIDIADLTNNTMLQSCGVAIYGGTDASGKEYLKNLLADIVMGMGAGAAASGTVDAKIGLTVNPTTVSDEVRQANINSVVNYLNQHLDESTTHTYTEYLLGGATYVA